MGKDKTVNMTAHERDTETREKSHYSNLFHKFIWLTLLCSLAPLLMVGWLINMHYTGFAKSKMIVNFRTQVEYHAKIIDLFLRERCSEMRIVAETHSKDYLDKVPNLFNVFKMMNREQRSIVDLGIIEESGRHSAYIGPYDLMDKDYTQALWFRQVMKQGIYISDMFMGFRKAPHFIIAVKRLENGKQWILRATIDTEFFRSLVENVRIGKTGEVYLLNREGIYQTSPRYGGKIMEKSPYPVEEVHDDIKIRIFDGNSKDLQQHPSPQIVAQTWLKEPRWMLVVRQEYSEAFSEVNHVNYATFIFLLISALTILIVTVFITKYMIEIIKKRDIEADQLNKQLLQTSKLASIGELSAGVAHEINNPLAIILTERQILLDQAGRTTNLQSDFKDQLSRSLSQVDIQVQRCKHITQNLLRFSRRTRSVIETVDINSFIQEVVELMEREAKSSGIKVTTQLDETLQPFLSDPSQLQQLFLNLITNAIDAHDGKSYGTIRISTRPNDDKDGLEILFADTGIGISAENLERIFDPFFTTKPVGKGTGLGLSICYSIIKRLGGDISVKSKLGRGTEFIIFLPYKPPSNLEESI